MIKFYLHDALAARQHYDAFSTAMSTFLAMTTRSIYKYDTLAARFRPAAAPAAAFQARRAFAFSPLFLLIPYKEE